MRSETSTYTALKESFKELKEVFRGNVGVMAISWFLFSLTGSLINPFFPKYAKDLGASDYDIATMRSLGTLALALSILPGGIITDLFGRVKIILIGTGLITLAQFLYALAPDWKTLTIVYILDNAAHFYQPALTAIVMDSLGKGREFKGFLALNIVTALPGLFMPIIGGILYDVIGTSGIRYGFLAQGMVSLVVLILRVRSLRETFKPRDRELSRIILELAGYRGVLTKAIKLYIFTSILWQIALGVVDTYMALYVIEELELSKPTWGLISGVSTLSTIISSLYLLGRQLNIEKAIIGSSIVVSTCIMLYSLPSHIENKLLILVIILLVASLSNIASNIMGAGLSALQTRILPVELRGRAVGIQRVLDNLGASISAQIAGLLYTYLGPSDSFIVSGLMGLASTFYLYVIVFSSRRVRGK